MESGVYYEKNQKYHNKYNLLVIRVNSQGQLVNARPCHNCTDMLKSCGIKNIYYSTEDGIICEKVKHMVSINSSPVSRLVERCQYKAPINDIEYYKNLLKKNVPPYIKKKNLNNFLNYNIKNDLPNFTWKIIKNKIIFYDNNNNYILTSIFY